MTIPFKTAVLDLETTGFRSSDRVIEIGVVLLDEHLTVEATWQTLVQPDRDIDNTHIHGISASDLVTAPRFAGIAAELAELLDGRVLVAHNAPFDTRFLSAEFARLDIDLPEPGIWSLCTRVLSRTHLPGAPQRLADCLSCAGLHNELPHAALADATATSELFRVLVEKYGARGGGVTPLQLPLPARPREGLLARGTQQTLHEAGHWLERLTATVPDTGVVEIDRYRVLLRGALLDHRLSRSEIEQLVSVAGELGLSRDEALEIHLDYLRQLAVEAWADGVVTAAERAHLHDIAVQLGVDPASVDALLAEPVHGEVEDTGLRPGDRVVFTGALALGRATWEQRARTAGLDVGGITRRSALLVAATPDSMSGKARRAREFGVPIVDETTFARMLRDLAPLDTRDAPESAETPATPYTELFPWLATLGVEPAGVDDIAQAWLKHHRNVPLHELSPCLNPAEVPDSLPRNGMVVARWLNRWPRPLEASATQLMDVPGFGPLRTHRTLVAVVHSALDARTGDYLTGGEEDVYLDDSGGRTGTPPREVETLTEWLALTGTLPTVPVEQAPSTVRRAWLTLAEDPYWADPATHVVHRARGELVRRIGTDQRDIDIWAGRIMGTRTLEEIGADHALTRERIRQLETQLKRRLVEPDDTLHLLIDALPQRYGALVRVSDVLRDLPALAEDGPVAGHSMLKALSWLADAWEVDGEWFRSADFDAHLAAALTDFADEYGVVSLSAVGEHLGVDKHLLAERLAGEATVEGDHVLTRTRTYGDRAAALLAIAGEPLTCTDLAARLVDAHPRSLSNAMAADPRTVRVGRDRWALADWGLEEYSTLAEWIGRRVEDRPVPLQDLLAEAGELGVSETSVRTYASSAEFQTVDGLVNRVEELPELDLDADETPGLYRVDGDWFLLVTVTSEHLRGSGSGVPRGVAVALGIPLLGKRTLDSPLGEQTVGNTRTGATVSTIRRFLEAAGIGEGERIWMQFTADGRFDIRRATPRSPGTGMAEILNVTGLDTWITATDDRALERLNTAVGLDAGAPRRRIVSRFRHRRQDDIADLILDL